MTQCSRCRDELTVVAQLGPCYPNTGSRRRTRQSHRLPLLIRKSRAYVSSSPRQNIRNQIRYDLREQEKREHGNDREPQHDRAKETRFTMALFHSPSLIKSKSDREKRRRQEERSSLCKER